ncbi:MAG: hypothetical protein WA988_01690 [Candidatus Nanopelagicales bacterium]
MTTWEDVRDDVSELDDELVARIGLSITDREFVTLGGGIGSFCVADALRIAGVPASAIAVVGESPIPYQRYQDLTANSQVPGPERLRSDSSGMPDNMWSFPSYAVQEAWQQKTLAPLFSVATEPILTDYWTPRAEHVFAAINRESHRIGYKGMFIPGHVRAIRRRKGGGYFIICNEVKASHDVQRFAIRARHVHFAFGYPGIRFAEELEQYRQADFAGNRLINAYEPHEFVYDALNQAGQGVVAVRGAGIVSSRVLQRLMEDRWKYGTNVQIRHLIRTFVDGTQIRPFDGRIGTKEKLFYKRRGGSGFAYQGYNWPKGSWGGQLKSRIENADPEDRKAIYAQLGGSHTPYRRLWQKQTKRAVREGWYSAEQATITSIESSPRGGLDCGVAFRQGSDTIHTDYVIDATGLESGVRKNSVVDDLFKHMRIGENFMHRIQCEPNFEVRNGRSGQASRLYASGAMTLGSYYVGVDSFLGLQYAALQVADDLASQGFCKKIGMVRSFHQWTKWARNSNI